MSSHVRVVTHAGRYVANVTNWGPVPPCPGWSLAHLLAAALEVLAFELPRLVICLGEVIGVDKAIATPETTERLLAGRETNRIVSGPP